MEEEQKFKPGDRVVVVSWHDGTPVNTSWLTPGKVYIVGEDFEVQDEEGDHWSSTCGAHIFAAAPPEVPAEDKVLGFIKDRIAALYACGEPSTLDLYSRGALGELSTILYEVYGLQVRPTRIVEFPKIGEAA